jgi:hypothetical protein
VIAVEGRPENAAIGQTKHPYPTLRWIIGDVRDLPSLVTGPFDVVLCLGILYHLGARACFQFLEQIAALSPGVTVIDTHVSVRDSDVVTYQGLPYHGWFYTEYADASTRAVQARQSWASLENVRSFWPTRPSLVNAMRAAGFTSVYECHLPAINDMPADRSTFIAFRHPLITLVAQGASDPAIYGERLVETLPTPAVSAPPIALSLAQRVRRMFRRLNPASSRITP